MYRAGAGTWLTRPGVPFMSGMPALNAIAS